MLKNKVTKKIISLFAILTFGFGASIVASTSASASMSSSTTAHEKVYFASGSAKLSSAAKKELRQIATTYKGATAIVVTGFVQKGVSSANNKALSKARAKAVVKYLKAKGMTASFTTKASGLPGSNASKNTARRVTLTITTEPAAATATHTVSGSMNGSIPQGFIRFIGGPCNNIGELGVTLDGATDFSSVPVQISNTCMASYSIPNVVDGTYTIKVTIDLAAMGANVSTVTATDWTVTYVGSVYTFTKTGLVVSSDTTVNIDPIFNINYV